ncbi:MAG: calcium/sodium antiporter [Patescibacteria group bacterium]
MNLEVTTLALALPVFIISLFVLVKGADYLIRGSERIGRYLGLPSFVIGALIVGIGTSLPELAASFAAITGGSSEIVVANAVGSNIANILLVAGLAAVIGRKIVTTKNLLDIEVPLLVSSSVLFLGTALDGRITQLESSLLFAGFIAYISYLLIHPDESEIDADYKEKKVKTLHAVDFIMLASGGVGLVLGAHYLIQSVQVIAQSIGVSEGVVAISAVALGTSLPEIIVSITAVMRGKMDLAFGNVFGSNVFNILMMVGFVGLFTELPIDPQTMQIGLPVFAAVTIMFVVSAMSKHIYIWEGLMFLIVYLFFIMKIFGLG